MTVTAMEKCGKERFDRRERFWGSVVYGVMWMLGQLPDFVHYFMADIIAFMVRRVMRYRVEVVEDNLRHAFPEVDDEEIDSLVARYYRHLGDLAVEYVMMAGFGRRRFLRHVSLKGAEVLRGIYADGVPNTFMVLGHFGNWEWYTGLQVLLPETRFYVLYQRQSRVWNYVFYRIRSKFGARLLDKETAPRQIIGMRKSPESKTHIFVADQVPSADNVHLFLPFLHRNTATFTGMERLARALHAPVVYISSRQPRRGRYEVQVDLLTEDASTLPENDLTVDFMARLERDIMAQPELWLWSHKRWKYSVEDVHAANPHQEVVQR